MEKAQQQRLVVLRTMDGASVRDIRAELEDLLKPIGEKPPSVSTIHAWQKAVEKRREAEAKANAALGVSPLPPRAPRPHVATAPTLTPTVEASSTQEASPLPTTTPPEPPPVDPIELADTDPRRVRDRSIAYYTKMIAYARSKAETALLEGRFREARDIGALAKAYEERRDELMPAPAPDPEKDPAYRAAGEQLIVDMREVVRAMKRGAALPPRTMPPVEVVQPS